MRIFAENSQIMSFSMVTHVSKNDNSLGTKCKQLQQYDIIRLKNTYKLDCMKSQTYIAKNRIIETYCHSWYQIYYKMFVRCVLCNIFSMLELRREYHPLIQWYYWSYECDCDHWVIIRHTGIKTKMFTLSRMNVVIINNLI